MKKNHVWFLCILLLVLGSLGAWLWHRHKLALVAAAAGIQSRYLFEDEGNPSAHPIAVVFVHGIFGDDTTWGAGDLTLTKLLASDSRLAGKIDIFLFEYSSPYLGNANKIADLAEQLRGALEDNGIWDHKKVIFVAHSMGGLIVRQYLVRQYLNHKEHIQQVPMMYFYGVPTDGAPVTQVARYISGNPQLQGMLPLEGNDFLTAVTNDWIGSRDLKQIPTYCAFEGEPTDGVWIVPQGSAIALCTEVGDPLTADHIQMVKPRSNRDPRFTRMATAIANAVAGPTTSEIPQPKAAAKEPGQAVQSKQIAGSVNTPPATSSPQADSDVDATEVNPSNTDTHAPVTPVYVPPQVAEVPRLDARWTKVRLSEITIDGRTFSLTSAFNGSGTEDTHYGTLDYAELGGGICSVHFEIVIEATPDPKTVKFSFDHKTVAVSDTGCLHPLPAAGQGTISTTDFIRMRFHNVDFLERVGALHPYF